MQIYVATSNAGKLRDFAHAASALNGHADGRLTDRIDILPLPGLNHIPAPPEDEPTFEGNARAKVLFYAAFAPGQLVLADDSGLEVHCLDGAPGVRSARYADDVGFPRAAAASLDERNNAALLRALDGVPELCREARYRCVLALARGSEILATGEGALDGSILTAPHGNSGFGYDPIFFVPEAGNTMAQLDVPTRLDLSHRGRALRNLLSKLTR